MKKVLLVEDDKNIVEIVEHILTTYGFDVYSHNSGLGVEKVISEYNPNVVLLDIQLPGKLGTQVCKDLKETSDIPIILFSAQPNQAELVKESNANAFLDKPFDIKELIASVGLYSN